MSIIGDPSADVVISQQMWINITSEAERLAAMAKECAAERDALRAEVERQRAQMYYAIENYTALWRTWNGEGYVDGFLAHAEATRLSDPTDGSR